MRTGTAVDRRQVVGGMVGAGLVAMVPWHALAEEPTEGGMNKMKLYFDDPEFDGQLKRTAAAAYSRSADLGEMLVAAEKITPGDNDSWWAAWSEMAERDETAAKDSAAGGHMASATEAWLRATEYWRQAIFFIRHDLDDARLQDGWRRHRAAFRAALPFLPFVTTVAEHAVRRRHDDRAT